MLHVRRAADVPVWRLERERLMSRSPYQRIVRAAKRGTGLRLSAEEASILGRDEAILGVAANEDAAEVAGQCASCLDRVLPPEGWYCMSYRLSPAGFRWRCPNRREVR